MKKENKIVKWWKKLAYWKRGGVIGFVVPTLFYIISIIILFFEKEGFMCVGFDTPLSCGIISSLLTVLIMYLFVFIMFVLPSIILGGLVGFIINKVKENRRIN